MNSNKRFNENYYLNWCVELNTCSGNMQLTSHPFTIHRNGKKITFNHIPHWRHLTYSVQHTQTYRSMAYTRVLRACVFVCLYVNAYVYRIEMNICMYTHRNSFDSTVSFDIFFLFFTCYIAAAVAVTASTIIFRFAAFSFHSSVPNMCVWLFFFLSRKEKMPSF